MTFDHETLVAFSKSYGLFYMMGFFAIVVIYAYWPSNKDKFDKAASRILEDEQE